MYVLFYKIYTKKIKIVGSPQIFKKICVCFFSSLTKTLLLPSLCQNFVFPSLVKIKLTMTLATLLLTRTFSFIHRRSYTICYWIRQFIAIVLHVVGLRHCASSFTFSQFIFLSLISLVVSYM